MISSQRALSNAAKFIQNGNLRGEIQPNHGAEKCRGRRRPQEVLIRKQLIRKVHLLTAWKNVSCHSKICLCYFFRFLYAQTLLSSQPFVADEYSSPVSWPQVRSRCLEVNFFSAADGSSSYGSLILSSRKFFPLSIIAFR